MCGRRKRFISLDALTNVNSLRETEDFVEYNASKDYFLVSPTTYSRSFEAHQFL